MLSYRHAYHAGNHADVLKHLLLMQVLQYITKKDTPVLYLDTHAGAGQYLLDSEAALKNREFETGVLRLSTTDPKLLPAEINAYLALVNEAKGSSRQMVRYPGSPMVAASQLRAYDRLVLCELHNREVETLTKFASADRRIRVQHEDGLKTMLALLPPLERRAVVLIDPSYEIKSDYHQIPEQLHKAWRKFGQGVFLLWYPLLPGQPGELMCDAIARSGIRDIQQFELQVSPRGEAGMAGSGMLVINPPWLLMEQMQRCLSVLADILGDPSAGRYKAEVRVAE